MKRAALLTAAAALFVVLATANAGGYRYGASDQAFYVPALAMRLDPTLFPHDRPLYAPQLRLWLGNPVMAALTGSPERMPVVFACIYVATLLVLLGGAIGLSRAIGASWTAAAAFAALLTLKHQITQTGANSLEGYAHPRMLAFAIGVCGLAWLLKDRILPAAAAIAVAGVVHVTTGLWFAAVLAVGAAWRLPRRLALRIAALATACGAAVLMLPSFRARLGTMDPDWLQAIGDRSYLFSGQWRLSTWLVNLGYAVVIVCLYRLRRRRDEATPQESALVAGLIALVAGFLVSVPLTEWRVALAVQLQVNRVFWLLDAVAACYIAWWLVDDRARSRPRVRQAIVAAVVLASAARGAYLLGVSPARPVVEWRLPATAWSDAMHWLSQRPERWHVLADPQHVARFGSSVRVAARRDTPLEVGKDPAMAIYDRAAAARVLERTRALGDFDTFTSADIRALATRYNLDVFVDRADRRFDFPVLFQNAGFIVYDLR